MSNTVRLNQIIAVAAGRKANSVKELSEVYKIIQKNELFIGLERTYRPINQEDKDIPPGEKKLLQETASKSLNSIRNILVPMFDAVLTQDTGNTEAKSDIIIEGTTLVKDVPVTSLIFLEKQLVDIKTAISSLPILPPDKEWSDYSNGVSRSNISITHRTKKVPRAIVKYPATSEHPAQTEMFTDDILVGFWDTISYSGGLSVERKSTLLDRVNSLIEAVKMAREAANSTIVEQVKVGDAIFDYILS